MVTVLTIARMDITEESTVIVIRVLLIAPPAQEVITINVQTASRVVLFSTKTKNVAI